MTDRPAFATASGGPGALRVLLFVAAVALAAVLGGANLTADQNRLILPTLATTAAFGAFALALARRIRGNVFGELGFVYLGFAVAYTAVPAISLVVLDLDFYQSKLSMLLPTTADLGVHLWRHALFVSGVGAGYLLFRGSQSPEQQPRAPTTERDHPMILLFLVGLIVASAACDWMLAGPVTTYAEFYMRFDHLSGVPLRIAFLAIALRAGANFALMTHLFRNFHRYRWTTIVAVVAICSFEIAYSGGSRINALIILLGAAWLYHHHVRPIGIRHGAIALTAIAVLFTVVELLRSSEFDVAAAKDTVAATGAMPAAEFSAVFFSGYHLYTERAHGSLPAAEWPMFLSELVALTPFVDHTRWNPMYWYARNFFPDALVPPETMGPIAESAIWGGELDLLVRSLVNGIFFACLVRWYVARQSKWWAVFIYAYCYATCAMTLKYSVFFHLVLLQRNVLPTIVLVAVVRRIANRRPSGLDPVPRTA